MVSIDIQYSGTFRPGTPCSGLEERYLAKVLQPDPKMIGRNVCCIPRRWPTIDPGLCFWKLHGVPHDLTSVMACDISKGEKIVGQADLLNGLYVMNSASDGRDFAHAITDVTSWKPL